MISVIVCTFNRAELLRELLQTLCAQTVAFTQYEVIVVDNGSTDQTKTVTVAFTTRYPQVRYCFEPRQGLSHARNRGWQEAKGDYVAYIDDDCKAPPDWLAVAQEIIETVAPVEFGGPHYPFYNTAKPHWWRDAYDSQHTGGYERAAGYLEPSMDLIGNNLFFQHAIFAQIGGFDPTLGVIGNTLRYGEETEMHVRLCRRDPTHRAYYDPRLFVYHLVRPEKLSLCWQLRSTFMHGRAYYPIYGAEAQSFTRQSSLFFPLYALLIGLRTLFQSWLWRDRKRYPYWQNYLYESTALDYCLHRLGMWSAYIQTLWPLRLHKRSRHGA
ncbi:MAG: glycosyltransferase [Caldilineaceae bacterium]|nr:glycosyltransferase [Caldilineaceae bacterium]